MLVNFGLPILWRFGCVAATIVLFLTFISSCRQKYPTAVEVSLTDAGRNSEELVKVLRHYETIDPDSLKFQAACYLIENMRLHFSLDTSILLTNSVRKSYATIDSLTHKEFFYPFDSSKFELADFLHQKLDTDEFNPTQDYIDSLLKHEYKRIDFSKADLNNIEAFEARSNEVSSLLLSSETREHKVTFVAEDLTSISSEWLIDHIDNAFVVWKESQFARNLTFAEFKNYILSYRCLYEYPDVKSSFLREKLKRVVANGNGDIATTVRRLNFYMYCIDVFEDKGKRLGNLGFYDILQFYKFDCDRHSEWTVRVLNACGIPAVMEFTSGFFNRNKLHYGVSVLDTSGKFRHFTPKWQALGDTEHAVMFSKVFRRTFSPRESPYTMKKGNEQIPFIFGDPFIEDVTDQYHKVIDVNLPYHTLTTNPATIPYLSIFTATGWRPIGWGKIDKAQKVVRFEKVPVGSCYIAGFYENGEVKPISELFQVRDNGTIDFYRPNASLNRTLTIRRKYPLKKQLVTLMRELLGAKIQGAADSLFSRPVDIYTVSKKDVENYLADPIYLPRKRKFRYWRLVGSNGKAINIAELEMFTRSSTPAGYSNNPGSTSSPLDATRSKKNPARRLTGNPLFNGQSVGRAFDHDIESYVNAYSIALDLSTDFFIDEIRILPRNANNGIVKGNTYELFYYDKKWMSLGKQIAKSNFLQYVEAPTNAVFWLKNHSGGKEEQIFLYKNGKQVFLNSENIIASLYGR